MQSACRISLLRRLNHSPNRGTGFLLPLVFISLLMTADALAADSERPAFPDLHFGKRMQGEEALNSLRDQLEPLAQFYRKSPQELQQLLRREKSLWLDQRGRMFYVCDWKGSGTTAPAPAEAA